MPAGATYEPISTTTFGSNTASLTINSIANSWTDLRLVSVVRSTRTSNSVDTVYIRFNSDSGTNYSNTQMRGNGSSATSGRETNQTELLVANSIPANAIAANTFSIFTLDIMSYAGSTNKSVLNQQHYDPNQLQLEVGLWRSTSAITSIYIYLGSGSNFLAGSSFTLYGIKAA